jgi:hypothetical protein
VVSWWLTTVYGPQADRDKLEFMQELKSLRPGLLGPWLFGGDFNLIYKAEDKSNSHLNCCLMQAFRDMLHELELDEIHLHGATRGIIQSSPASIKRSSAYNGWSCSPLTISGRCPRPALTMCLCCSTQTLIFRRCTGFILKRFVSSFWVTQKLSWRGGRKPSRTPTLAASWASSSATRQGRLSVGVKNSLVIFGFNWSWPGR